MPKTTTTAAQPRRIEYMPLDDLPDADRNPKGHDTARIAGSISRFGFADAPILDERTGQLVAGHGRKGDLIARKEAGQDPPEGIQVDADGRWLVPVQRGWASRSAEDAEAFLVAHNRLTETGGWDDRELAEMLDELRDIDPDLLDVTGYSDDDIDELITGFGDDWGDGPGGTGGEEDGDKYTRKANVPQYEIKGERPAPADLVDTTKAERLIERINAHPDLPDDVRDFLLVAARRHQVFHYAAIAEFYAHADPDVQELMEESALVIIDVDDAIKNGYTKFTQTLNDILVDDLTALQAEGSQGYTAAGLTDDGEA